jgi:hypothetical protein
MGMDLGFLLTGIDPLPFVSFPADAFRRQATVRNDAMKLQALFDDRRMAGDDA